MWIAMYTIIYGGFTAGQANQWGPDISKGTKAALKVFKVIDKPSEIDAMDVEESAVKILPNEFKGKIQFRDVWFRYPTRLQEWVFHGLNLKHNYSDDKFLCWTIIHGLLHKFRSWGICLGASVKEEMHRLLNTSFLL